MIRAHARIVDYRRRRGAPADWSSRTNGSLTLPTGPPPRSPVNLVSDERNK